MNAHQRRLEQRALVRAIAVVVAEIAIEIASMPPAVQDFALLLLRGDALAAERPKGLFNTYKDTK